MPETGSKAEVVAYPVPNARRSAREMLSMQRVVGNSTVLTLIQRDQTATGKGAESEDPVSLPTPLNMMGVRYTFQGDEPIMEATVDLGAAILQARLTLRGQVSVSAGSPLSIDQQGQFRIEAKQKVDQWTSSLRLTEVNSGGASMSDAFGNRFSQTELKINPDGSLAVGGAFKLSTELDGAALQGQLGVELTLKVTPKKPPATDEPDTSTDGWWDRNGKYVIATGIVLIVIVAAIPTEGADIPAGAAALSAVLSGA